MCVLVAQPKLAAGAGIAPAVWLLALLAACGHGRPAGRAGEGVLERGGELAAAEPLRARVEVTRDTVAVWGLTEVPDGSRLQAALAGVAAITRSELLRIIEVRVRNVDSSSESSDPARTTFVTETVEAVAGVLARGGPLPHGWARVRRGDEVVIRLWARLEVPRTLLEQAIRPAAARAGHVNASVLLDGLGAVAETP